MNAKKCKKMQKWTERHAIQNKFIPVYEVIKWPPLSLSHIVGKVVWKFLLDFISCNPQKTFQKCVPWSANAQIALHV